VFVNHALASSSQAPNRLKYYFSPHGTLPPRLAFGYQPKGDQPALGCRLGLEGPKGGEIKEKVEGTRLRQAIKWLMITVSQHLG
jgi:hypothetical protein